MSTEDYVGFAIQPYQESPRLRFLVNLLPGVGGAIDAALTSTLENVIAKREERFFEALEAGRARLKEEFANSEPFVHRYLVTSEAVVREAEESKIALFANLLLNAPTETALDESGYKQLLQILNDLSAREVALLDLLETFESNVAERGRENVVQSTEEFWADFVDGAERELGIPRAEFTGTLTRVSRTGCYCEATGAYLGYPGGRGETTGLWRKFKKFVLDQYQAESQDADSS
jgi:hypothetical protein